MQSNTGHSLNLAVCVGSGSVATTRVFWELTLAGNSAGHGCQSERPAIKGHSKYSEVEQTTAWNAHYSGHRHPVRLARPTPLYALGLAAGFVEANDATCGWA